MKLSPFTVYVIGASLSITALSFGFFMQKVPNDAERDMNLQVLEQLQAEAAKQRRAEEKVQMAIAKVRQRESEWRQVATMHTPPNNVQQGGISLAVNSFQLTEDTRKFRDSIQRTVNGQLKRGGVTVINGPMVPAVDVNAPANSLLASFYNFPAVPFPVVIFDLGSVTIQGNYNQIMSHLRSYKSMPRYLAVTDGLVIEGTSPNLTATYNLTVVGYIQQTGIAPAAPEGQAAAGGAGGGGGFPGFGGGAPAAAGGGGPMAAGMPGR
jgi:hypothetical protein